MSFTQIPSLVSFSPLTTILSADVNANYAAIRNAFNGLVTGSNTIAVDTITENTAAHGVTINKAATFSAGVATFASGIAITGGIVSGVATFSSGFAISGGVVSGLATFSSGIIVTGTAAVGGALTVAGGITASGASVFSSGVSITAGTLTIAVGTAATTAKPTQVLAQVAPSPAGSTSYNALSTATLTGNSLAANATQLKMVAAGFSADTGWDLRWTIGSNVVISATQAASGNFYYDAIVSRVNATLVRGTVRRINGTTVALSRVSLSGVDLTADQTVSLAFVTSTTVNLLTLDGYCLETAQV